MKALMVLLVVLVTAPIAASAQAATTAQPEISGKWSGSWFPQGGIIEYVTVELKQETAGKIIGKFVFPAEMTFTKASLDPKTGMLAIEAADKSGKQYKLDGKFSGTKFSGTLTVGSVKGSVDLAKWILMGS